MATINGDWFHSRSSSNWDELIKVRLIVLESQKKEYAGFGWSGGRINNPKMYKLAEVANIEPSTMQTKIRAMIRYGFVRDGNVCPLIWTRMGSLWNELYSVGNFKASSKIYELTLTISLAIYAFNDSLKQYTLNPIKGELPLKFLFSVLDNKNSISHHELKALIDGNTSRVGGNTTYWKRDLVNCGLFKEVNGELIYTGKYKDLVKDIKNFQPNPLLDDNDWKEIRDNPLVETSPFNLSISSIFENISQEQDIEDQLLDGVLTEPLIDIVAEQEEHQVPEIDILSTDLRFAQSMRRIRNATWSLRIKKKYDYICAVPNCDVTGLIFVEAAHIKPDNVPESNIPHRAHILNGLCLCKNCHIAFDKGYFSLTDNNEIITSNHFKNIPNQHLKTIITSSANLIIKPRTDKRTPLQEFIQYHRNNCFKI